MSNDQSNNERFIPFDKSNTVIPDDLRSMDKGKIQNSFIGAAIPTTPKDFASEFKTTPNNLTSSRSGQINEVSNQVEGFMKTQNIQMPPESVVSLPMTSFEDTQQMLKAYKKKKREIAKMKEQFFKIETEFMTLKQKNILLEEELAQTQKKYKKAEKALKKTNVKDPNKDLSLVEKQLSLKSKEAEVFQKELTN